MIPAEGEAMSGRERVLWTTIRRARTMIVRAIDAYLGGEGSAAPKR